MNGVPANGAMAPKLTKWANEPTAGALKQDLENARPAHDAHVGKVTRWNNLLKVEGSAKPAKVKGRSSVQPKLIRRQAEWRYSALTEPFNSSERLFDVQPVTWQDGDAARQNELLLNWQFRTKINRVKFIDEYVRTTVDEGTCIVRPGWCRYTSVETQDAPVWTHVEPTLPEHVQRLDQAVMLQQTDPDAYAEQVERGDPALHQAVGFFHETGKPSVATQTGVQKVKVEKVIDNRPTVGFVNPANFYADPSCGSDFDKARFCVVSFETSRGELLKEKDRYKNLEFVNWEGSSPATEPHHAATSTDTNFNFMDKTRKRVVAYEYWGLWDVNGDGKLVPIVATWIGDTLIRLEENPFPDGKPPFVVVPYMPLKRELMGEPDAELLEDNQKILGAVSRGMIDLLGRSANGQQGFAKGMLDVVNKRRYEAGQDYEFNPNLPPQQGLIEHKFPEIPQSAMLMLQLQNEEAEALTGVKAFSGGLSGESYGQVAAGIRGVLDAAAKREMAILRRLANGLVEIGRKIVAMNAVFLSDQETVQVTKEQYVQVSREELAGEFNLVVDISTAEIDSNKSQDLAFMLQTLGPTVNWDITKMILAEIARLKRMPELRHQILAYQPQPDPVAAQLQQLEVQKLQLEIAKLQSEVQLNQAKTLQAHTDAEQTALDTVEQETGTTHAREIEKQTAQSTGNQNLEVTKALVKPKKKEESKPDIEAAVGFNQLSRINQDSRTHAVADAKIG
jgi:hypothetical protein